MSEHSILPPSSASRRWQCSASTMMEARYPQTEESDDSKDGTAAHWGLAEMLEDRVVAEGQITPNGVYLTEAMIEGGELMVDDIANTLRPYGLVASQGKAEVRVAIPSVHQQSWGTPDYRILLGPINGRYKLFLWDFKYGHRVVEVFENAQLVEYVAGCLDEIRFQVSDLEVDVVVTIVQPRAPHRDGPVRKWSFRAEDIRGLVNRSHNVAHEALGPNATAKVGPECRDCKARHACTTLMNAGMEGCDYAGKPQPFDLSLDAMALEYRTLEHYREVLRARQTGLEEQLLAHGKRGARLPGLSIEHAAGRQRWTLPPQQVIAIGQALGVHIAKEPDVMTPKQAIKAGLPEAALEGITNRPRGEAKLVLDDGSLARRVFSQPQA